MVRSHLERCDAVNAAREVFWRNGYDETSIAELVSATGFNRYALYRAFGGKLKIFLAALDDYYAERRNIFLENINNPEAPPLNAIRSVIEFAVSQMADRRAGCLLFNVASTIGRQEKVIMERIDSYLLEMKNAYEIALARAAERGELNQAVTPEQGAHLLLTLQMGLGALASTGASYDDMMRACDAGLAVLGREQLQ